MPSSQFTHRPKRINVRNAHQLAPGKKKRRKGNKPSEGLLYEPKIWTKTFCAESDSLYDRVLVDAECTHDGSLKHLIKCKDIGWDKFVHEFIGDEEVVNGIVAMQKRLLAHGVAMTRPGGYVVYSTCSLTRAQNEDVVLHALQTMAHIELVPIDLPNLPVVAGSTIHSAEPNEGRQDRSTAELPSESQCGRLPFPGHALPHVLRFDPLVTQTSGLFIAKFRRLKL
ncbi:hypothetical protein SARC_07808 [Sphaeroforma arctica JP610]|uniref:SAM-dependent MTase RsmB/NOP-type domain-containing protein n=1 Tax=Sphaeroforma arctica JP610 TaxID=667725 RepID=A0A0L0FT02_9EUKA|nr:hypothetical protein SARC_07808 [Sphaeroforma arctica JP610]KNC79809.1 hypothetical protein SARC_07808 [Sphaeroforma arctica JP610]|eukprot:XP_014153711.1 hypothetical protein SARC_07808 [Sphaeroforma arctica JP610]